MAEEQGGAGLDELFTELRAQNAAAAQPVEEVPAEEPSEETGVAVAEGVDPAKPPEEPEAPPAHHSVEQPRDQSGRFAPKQQTEGTEGELESDYELVRLAGEDGDELEIEVPDKHLAERIAQLQEKAKQAEKYNEELAAAREQAREVQARQEELDEIQGFIAQDPVGYLVSRVRPELRQQVVLDILLTDDDAMEAASEAIQKWAYEPHERRVAAAESRAKRVEQEAKFRESRERRQAIQQRAQVLNETMHGFIPTDMPPDQARRFANDMNRDLIDYGNTHGWADVRPETLREILSFRLEQYGVDPKSVPSGAPRDNSGLVVARPSNEAAKRIEAARKESERLRLSYQRRRAAGASTPVGAGTPVNRARPPKGASLKEALDWAQQNIGGA